jgi:uncharacterized protein YkwD
MRFGAALLTLTTALVLAPAALAAPAGGTGVTAQDAIERPIVAELNRVRAAHGLGPLRTVRPLRVAADAHAASMARGGYFSHTSADGTSFDRRVARFYRAGGYRNWTVGENLLWSSSAALTPAEAVRMWMASPGHRKNILSPRWREIGISAVRAAGAPGVFGGRDVTIVVTDFGARA